MVQVVLRGKIKCMKGKIKCDGGKLRITVENCTSQKLRRKKKKFKGENKRYS